MDEENYEWAAEAAEREGDLETAAYNYEKATEQHLMEGLWKEKAIELYAKAGNGNLAQKIALEYLQEDQDSFLPSETLKLFDELWILEEVIMESSTF